MYIFIKGQKIQYDIHLYDGLPLQARGQKRGTPKILMQTLSSPSTPKSKMPSIPFVPALLPIGEDEASMKRQFKMMQNELKKVVPIKKIVIDLMRRTFPL